MSRAGKGFLFLIYFAAVVGLVTAIALSFRSDRTSVATISGRAGRATTSVVGSGSKFAPGAASSNKSSSTANSNPAASAGSQASSALGSASDSSGATLVNTGPGSTLGLFVLASLAGVLVHRRLLVNRR